MNVYHKLIIFIMLIFVTINNSMGQGFQSSLPKIGDEWYSCTHQGKVESFMIDFDRREIWDFNFLQSFWSISEKFESSKNSPYAKYFPQSQMVLKKVDNQEEFYYTKDGSLYSLGKVIEAPFLSRNRLIIYFTPAKRIINTAKKIGQTYDNNYTITMKFARKDILEGLQFIPEQFDSLMIETTARENVSVTEEGHMIYSNSSKKVQKHEAIVQYLVRGRVKKIGQQDWKPFDKLSLTLMPDDIKAYLRSQKYTRVDFISPDFKGVALTYEMQNKNVSHLEYQDIEPSPYMKSINYTSYDVIASPNPTTGNITIRLFNYPFDQYTLELYNVVGKKIFSKPFHKKEGRLLHTDISNLKRGTYMYSVLDSKGKKLMTKRISLIGL